MIRPTGHDTAVQGRAAAALRQDPSAGHIMLSAAGRRVALLRLLRESQRELGLSGGVLAMDLNRLSAAMNVADAAVTVPPYRDPSCLSILLNLCREQAIRLIVPTIDTELAFYASHARQFAELGCHVNISSAATIEIAGDKQKTHEFLTRQGFPTVEQGTPASALADRNRFALPLIIKPRFGSSSIGLSLARTYTEVEARAAQPDLIAQTLALGDEYTVDVYIDRSGRSRCAVPRRRLETRGGEVSKGMTVRHPAVSRLAREVADALPDARGVINIQIFHDPASGALRVIELNARFGGGYPLAHEAGAPMARWLLEETMGRPCTATDDAWRAGVVMLRYDESVFVDCSQVGLEPLANVNG